jgi:L-alanine-DL-glutamate epimerase-like enolase superfamily enzyme
MAGSQGRHRAATEDLTVRITDLLVDRCTAPLKTPFTSRAISTTSQLEAVLVRVVADNGLSGWGEAVPVRGVGEETTAGAEARIAGPMRDVVVGRRLDDADDLAQACAAIERAADGARSVRAALDIAVHDLAAQHAAAPLNTLFGGTESELQTAVTLALGPPRDMARQAEAWAARGFSALKVKVGQEPEADLRRVRAVRAAAGPRPRLWLDANQGWDARTAVTVLRTIEDSDLGVDLVEQPVPGPDLEALAFVRRHTGIPVVADEAVLSYEDAVEVVRREAADVLNVKVQKNGGISGALRVVELAEQHQLPCMVGCTLETTVSITAAASALATRTSVPYVDLDAPLWLARPPVLGGVEYTGPRLRLPDAPGLGIHGQTNPHPEK